MTTYNTKPSITRAPLVRVVEIGWQHHIEGEGDNAELVYDLDENGEPMPTVYRFPTRATAQAVIDGVRSIGPERAALLATGGAEAMVELVGAVLGEDIVLTIAGDPTVSSDAFMTFITDTVSGWGLADALPPEADPGN